MKTAIIFDCEFLVVEGAPQNFWCGPFDPDPVIAQIGAAKLHLRDDFAILDTLRVFVTPVDRHGRRYPLDPLFTKLTGITDDTIAAEGIPLKEAIDALDRFSEGA